MSETEKGNRQEADKPKRPRRAKRARGAKGRGINKAPILAAIVFILVVLVAALGSVFIKKYTPTKERADLQEYYNVHEADDMAVVLDQRLLEEKAKLWDGHVYLDYNAVRQYLNQRFYWDANENILRYTTDSDVISVNAGEKAYMIGKKANNADYTIVKADGEAVYLALDFVQEYTNLDFSAYAEPNRVQITSSWGEIPKAKVKKKTSIRVLGGIKSPIVSDVAKGSSVIVIDSGDDWSRVCTEDGMIGYLKNNKLGEVSAEKISRAFEEPQFTHLLKEETVSLGWHQVTAPEANERVANILQATKGINVISPTWFYLNDDEGNIYSLADRNYVTYCHEQGVEVWGLVSNLENPDVDTTYVMTHTSTRDYLTNQIIAAAIEYDLDGVNLDFEALSPEAGDAYVQFVRELSIKCENNDLVLSVDNYVPSSYTEFYNRAEQAVFADYIIIMAYDEHYSGSEDIGPVSSIGFVKNGVKDTLKEVPPEQTILAVPFYSRIWEMTPKDGSGEDVESVSEDYVPYTFTCTEEGMQTTEDIYKANLAEAVWSEEDGSYVAEYTGEGKDYKVWVENEASLEEKLKVMKEHKLAGAAYWKLGLERPSAWDTIIKYVN